MKYNKGCPNCENGWVEVDPAIPEDAGVPQYRICACVLEEYDYYDEYREVYEDNDNQI